MNTPEEMETAVCQGIRCFEQESRGRFPTEVRAQLIRYLLFVRLHGVLTVAELQLAKSPPARRGRDLLKQVRCHLIETAKPLLQAMVQGITGLPVVSLHHDISTLSGEAVILFTLVEAPFATIKKR